MYRLRHHAALHRLQRAGSDTGERDDHDGRAVERGHGAARRVPEGRAAGCQRQLAGCHDGNPELRFRRTQIRAALACADPTPNAIIRLQRLRDNGNAAGGACTYAASQISSDYWPNALFDVREALQRDNAPADRVRLGGVMYYVALDVNNLRQWFAGAGVYAGGSGTGALNNNG